VDTRSTLERGSGSEHSFLRGVFGFQGAFRTVSILQKKLHLDDRFSRSIPDGVDFDLDMRATQRDVPHSRVRFATQA
jgi:hypothetical protein